MAHWLQLDVMEPTYLKMRMKLVVSMWPYVEIPLGVILGPFAMV